jgi:hypothetical protein
MTMLQNANAYFSQTPPKVGTINPPVENPPPAVALVKRLK